MTDSTKNELHIIPECKDNTDASSDKNKEMIEAFKNLTENHDEIKKQADAIIAEKAKKKWGIPQYDLTSLSVTDPLFNEKREFLHLCNEKIEFLHLCLVPSSIPSELPEELSAYDEAFEIFKKSVQGCTDGLADQYVNALRIFRDILLGQ